MVSLICVLQATYKHDFDYMLNTLLAFYQYELH